MKNFIRKIAGKISDMIESRLRKLCYGMSRDVRVIVIVCIVIILTFGSLFGFATAIYQVGKYKGKQEFRIEHISIPELLQQSASEKQLKGNRNGEE